MKTFTKGLMVAAVVFGLGLLGNANTASAAYPYVVYNGGYAGYSGYVGSGIGYGGYVNTYRPYVGYGSLYVGSVGPTWHDTSHYDYHPGRVVRHGNHLHVQPGHYHLHQTGHLHW